MVSSGGEGGEEFNIVVSLCIEKKSSTNLSSPTGVLKSRFETVGDGCNAESELRRQTRNVTDISQEVI
jgi:hypothetical protein